jgi:hypothetical protein
MPALAQEVHKLVCSLCVPAVCPAHGHCLESLHNIQQGEALIAEAGIENGGTGTGDTTKPQQGVAGCVL